MDQSELEAFAHDSETTCECLQVVPMGGGRAAMLFLLADPDYVTTVSVVFVTDGFTPEGSRQVLLTAEWLTSLSAAPSGELFALEATTTIWRMRGAEWTRDTIAEIDQRRVWAKAPGGPIAIGANGTAYRLDGQVWQPVPPIGDSQYFDAHALPGLPVHACGDWGTLHRLESDGWHPIETNCGERFRGLDVAADGTIRLAGDNGVCLRLRQGEAVRLAGSDLTCFAVRSFRDRVYWGDEAGLYIEEGDDIIPFAGTDIVYDLRTDNDFLYLASVGTAWRFDGDSWKTLTLIYDGGFRLV